MRNEFLPFSRPDITESDIEAVNEVLRSGWITTGKRTAQFEEDFCSYTGAAHAVALSSATAGMHVLLRALDIGPGDEVVTPSMTWVSTVNLIVLAGATPVFADVDRDTLMVTPDELRAKMTDRTKLVVPVHFAGAPCDMSEIRDLTDRAGVRLVEDAAHALGTVYRGEKVGGSGTAIFSFHPIKNITTGEGGMFCSDDEQLVERVRRLKFHGLGVDAYDRQSQGRSPQAEVIEPGYKYNMPDILGVLGVRQLARIDEFNGRRNELSAAYIERLAGIDEIMPLTDPTYPHEHARHLFIVRLDIDRAGIARDEFMAALKERNVGTGLHFRAAHLQKYYVTEMNMQRGMLPHTEWNSDRICSLPLFPAMSVADVDDVIAAIKEVLKN